MFEWDEVKNKTNQSKHGISFEDVIEVFDNSMVSKVDDRYDYGEVRYISIGKDKGAICYSIVYTYRGG